MLIMYHFTSREAADAILRSGFINNRGTYMTSRVHEGVWLTDEAVNISQCLEACLAVELPFTYDEITQYEWVGETTDYREWLIPAQVLNGVMTVAEVCLVDGTVGALPEPWAGL